MKQSKDDSINSLLIDLGLVFFIAQSVEYNLVTLLGMAKKSGELKSEDNITELMTKYYSRTMGNVKRSVSELININENLESILKVALDTRNWLAHNFYREYAPTAFNESYRNKAKIVLNKAKDIFERTNELLTEEIIEQGIKCGIPREDINKLGISALLDYVTSNLEPNEMWDKSLDKTSWQKYKI